MNVLGIDFGTSNTVAVLASPDRPPRVLMIDTIGWLPSCIYVEDDGSLAVGRDAERKARLAPERFEANPKRRIDDGEILLGVRVVPVVDAIAAVLRRVAEEARRQLNGRSADQVNLTHPAQWGSSRQNVLLAAARAAGLGPTINLVPEPVAAATHFASLPGRSLPPGGSLAVYDLGGGTFDCAVVGVAQSGFTVLAEAGLPDVGGVDFDQAVVDHLGRTISADDPARWQALARPRTAADRRAARSLREDVRAAKETLSRYAQTDLPLPEPFEDTLLTRKEFDGLIRPVIARTVDVLAETIGRAGLRPDQVAGVYLVGGSSRIPVIATMITERLGVVPVTLDQPETSVALGAALVTGQPRPQGRTDLLSGPDQPRPPLGPPSNPMTGSMPPPRPAGPPHSGGQQGPGGGFTGRGEPATFRGQQFAGVPAPDAAAKRKRRIQTILIAAIVAVIAATAVIVTVVINSGSTAGPTTPGSTSQTSPVSSTPPTTPPSTTSSNTPAGTCATDRDDRGVTPCMKDFIGELNDLRCTQDVASLGANPDSVKAFEALTTSWTACVDQEKGFVVLVFQAYAAGGREAIWSGLVKNLNSDKRDGSWTTDKDNGTYQAGADEDSKVQLAWKSADRPLFAYMLATGQSASSDDIVQYWRAKVGAELS